MRLSTGAVAVAASVAATLCLCVPATGAAPESLTGKGTLASVELVVTDTITGADGSAAVRTTEPSLLAEHILFDPSGTSVIVEFESLRVDILVHDGCTGLTTELDGLLSHGRGHFEQAANGRPAVVSAGIMLLNRTTGVEDSVARVELAFTATSRPVVTVEVDRTVGAEGRTLFRTTMRLREAAVTGTFLLDGRDLLADAQHVEATIGPETLVSRTQVTTG